MNYLESLGAGLQLAASWENILHLAIGVIIGVAFGAIPGLSGALAITLLLPFTFFLSPVAAMGLLLGTYKGCMFGGSISAITFGIPGDAPAAATVFDGFPLCKKGKPFKALHTALYSSIMGNFLADLVVIFTFIPLGIMSLAFGPRELFALMLVAVSTLVIFSEGKISKTLIGAAMGFFIGTIGLDPIMAYPRLTFGIRELESGIPLVPFCLGVFAFTEMLVQFAGIFVKRAKTSQFDHTALKKMIKQRSPEDRLTVREWFSYWREWLIGSATGIFLGAVPGPGGTMAAFSSYALVGKLSKNKGRMGTGIPEGIAGPESGNSATVGPTLIPLFAFGIPGSGIAAIFAGAFMMQGLTPGPGLFTDHLELMLAIFMLMLVGTFLNLFISKYTMIPIFARLGMIESRVLVPVLVPMMMVGMYAISIRTFDVVLMVVAGLLGLAMRRFKIPFSPTLVAMMIGPMFEKHFRRGLIISGGDLTYWFSSTICIVLYVMLVVVVLIFIFSAWRSHKKAMNTQISYSSEL